MIGISLNKYMFPLRIISVFIVFICINIASNALISNSKIDLTQGKLYTLSSNTKKILSELEEPINIKLFFSDKLSRDLPALRDFGQRVRELLNGYVINSNGKIKLERIDPEPFTDLEDMANVYGVEGVSVNEEGEKFYFGMVASNSIDDMLVLPFFDMSRENFLEYDLTRIISNLANPKKATLGLISSLPINGGLSGKEPNPTEYTPPYFIHQRLIELFNVRDLGKDISSIPENIDQLIIVHPKKLSDNTLYAIDQFVLSGKGTLIFVDPFSEIDRQSADPNSPGLNIPSSNLSRLFKAWGFDMLPGMIVGDQRVGRKVSIGNRGNSKIYTYILWLALQNENISKNDITTANLNYVFLKTAGALVRSKKDITFEPLLTSTSDSMLVERYKIQQRSDPRQLLEGFLPDEDSHILAARVSGSFDSAFSLDDISNMVVDNKLHVARSKVSNIIVFADTDLLADDSWVSKKDAFGRDNITQIADNGPLVINAIESLSGGNNLINLRSRGVSNRPFRVVEELELRAELSYRETEKTLQKELDETQNRLKDLQINTTGIGKQEIIMSADQKETIEAFKNQIVAIRKQLRDVQRNLSIDIDNLNANIQLFNIWLMPFLVLLFAVVNNLIIRKKRIKYLKKIGRANLS